MRRYLYSKILHSYTARFVALCAVVGLISLTSVTPAYANVNPLSVAGTWLGDQILTLVAKLVGVSGMLLALTIDWTVIGMGKFITQETSIGSSINQSWTIIRDICNLAFIFGFIYIGIKMILDSDDSGTKQLVAKIVIGALLINFSLYFTKVIIDASNYLASEIYTQAAGGNPKDSRGDIGLQFANNLGISSFYIQTDKVQNDFKDTTAGGKIWFYIMGGIFLLLAAFVLAAGAVLLIIRFVALVFLMIFSPILFAGTIFPATQGAVKMLWSKLVEYSLFAPVYFLLLFISLKVTGATTAAIRKGSLGDAFQSSSGQYDTFGVVLNFMIIIMFMIMSLVAAQKLSIAGGGQAVGMMGKMRGYGQRAVGASTAGLAAKLGRATLGRAGDSLSDKKWLKDAAAKSGAIGFGARQLFKASKATGDASFDARNVAGIGGTLGVGEGRKGGYTTIQKEIKEKEEKFVRSLGELDDTDSRVQARKREMEAKEKELRRREEVLQTIPRDRAHLQDRTDARDEIEKAKKEVEKAKRIYEQEKQRRVIGSTFAEAEHVQDRALKDNFELDIKNKKEDIRKLWESGVLQDGTNVAQSYANLGTDELKRHRRERIEEFQKELEDLENSLSEHLTKTVQDRGYAGVMEKGSWWNTWILGRLVAQEHEAGKEIRKTAEKGLPKEK